MHIQHPRGLAVPQQFQCTGHQFHICLQHLVAGSEPLLKRHVALLQTVQIGNHQLGLDRLRVRHRVDASVHMGDVIILEAAQHVDDGIHFTDVTEELVAQTLPLRRAAHQPGNVHEGELGRNQFLRPGQFGQLRQAWIRHPDLAEVRLDRAEGIVRRLRRSGLRQGVEKGGLADVGQTDDPAFETHLRLLLTQAIFRALAPDTSAPPHSGTPEGLRHRASALHRQSHRPGHRHGPAPPC